MTAVEDDVDGFDDIRMFERRTDAKFCGNLLPVLLFCLTRPFGPELLNSKWTIDVLFLDKADGTASARTKDANTFAILLFEMHLSSFRE